MALSQRARRALILIPSVLIGLPVSLVLLALCIVLVGANVGAGRHYIERQTTVLTGGTVHLTGLSGRFPDALRAANITLSDRKGVWLSIDNLALDWSPLRLAVLTARVDRLSFDRLSIPRLPVADTTQAQPASQSGGSSVPGIKVDVRALEAHRIEVGREVAGTAAAFALNGHAMIATIAPILGGVSVETLPDTDIALNLTRLDTPATLALTTRTLPGTLAMTVAAHEAPGGFLSTQGGLAALDPLDLHLALSGPRQHAALDFALQAGALSATTRGTVDLVHPGAAIRVEAHAPAMALGAMASWQSLALGLDLQGALTAPQGSGTLTIDGLSAGGAGFRHLAATFTGVEAASGHAADSNATLHAAIEGLHIPGPQPALLAAAPLTLDLGVHPFADGRPVNLTLDHPLLQVVGQARTAGALSAAIDVNAPDLAPLAAMGGTDLRGQAKLRTDLSMPQGAAGPAQLALDGTLAITGGLQQAVDLVGPDGRLSLRAHMTQDTATGATSATRHVTIQSLTFDGRKVHLTDDGTLVLGPGAPVVDDHATLSLPDLAAASTAVHGHAALELHASGPTDDLAADLHLDSVVGTPSVADGPLTLKVSAAHLPSRPQATLIASGILDRAPFDAALGVVQDADGARHLSIDRLSWNSLSGNGALVLPAGKVVPLGTLDLKIARLADFSRLAGQTLSGTLTAAVRTQEATPQTPAVVSIDLHGALGAPQARIRSLALTGHVSDPTGTPNLDLALKTDGLAVGTMAAGRASVTTRGTLAALAVQASADMTQLAGAPGNLRTDLTLDLPGHTVAIRTLSALAKGESIRLLAPATIAFGGQMGVDHLRATLGPVNVPPASIDIAGTVKPTLALTAHIGNLTPAIGKPFAPDLDAVGTIALNAQLAGTLAQPKGKADLVATGLRMRTGNAASIPPANIRATADLAGTSATVDARVDAGPKVGLTARGTVPTDMKGPLAVRADGSVDLSLANGILGASGREAKGLLRIAMAVAGTAAQPRATGRVDLTGGEVQDFAQGVRLTDITAGIVAAGDRIVIERFDAKAGKGGLALAGSVGAFQPGIPVALTFTAHDATPISSDLITATMNADMAIKGMATQRIDVSGSVTLPEVEVNIPNAMPASVATLDVVRPGDKPPAPVSATRQGGMVVGLDVHVVSPGHFFVRGHGLDAEMAGNLHVTGEASAPVVEGGFDMRRGNFNLAAIDLNFTHGRVAFNGSGVAHKLDPTLDFQADRNVSGTTARLSVGGYASDPKITFSSIPSLPQDQVLALLLFGKSAQDLSTTELAEVGAALASLAGGSSFDPLGTVRKSLGLDRLQLGGGSGVGNGGASLEAGKYVMRGVYVGAKQATSGSGTQAQVQVDLTKRLKLNTTVGTGGNVTGFTTPENDPGSSVGLLYQFDY